MATKLPLTKTANDAFPVSLFSYPICFNKIFHSEVASLATIVKLSGKISNKIPEHEITYKQLIAGMSLCRSLAFKICSNGTVSYSCDLPLFLEKFAKN
jgi:hypothetical protein